MNLKSFYKGGFGMKIEKINDNKIRITLTNSELEARNLDFQSLRYNTPEAQTLFFDMMKMAETEHGFHTANCQLFIEAASVNGGQFIVTITKLHDKVIPPIPKKKTVVPELKVKKKTLILNLIYRFDSFEQICELANSKLLPVNLPTELYEYNNVYFLSVKTANMEKDELKKTNLIISEFGELVQDSEMMAATLSEHGNRIMKQYALKKVTQYFSKI